MLRRAFNAAAVAATLALAALAATAHAGQYHVYSCRTPSGEPAPVDGWSGSVAPGSAYDDYAVNTCGEGGALVAALGDATIHGSQIDKATWGFSTGTANGIGVVSATLWRAGYLQPAGEGSTYQLWMTGPNENLAFEECIYSLGCSQEGTLVEPLALQNRVGVPASSLGPRLFVNVNCGVVQGHICQPGADDPTGFAAAIYIYAADLTLEQGEGPHVSDVSGELASAAAVQGQSDVVFDATDPGSGVYQAVFSVDGQVVQRTVIDANEGRCRDVGQTNDGLPAFLYVRPCPSSVSADVPFETTETSNGVHHLVVSVTDAAGNAATVLDRNITIDNPTPPGAPNGTNASTQATLSVRWNETSKASLVSGYGRSRTISGQLTAPGGVPIAGAAIDLRALADYAGATPLQMPSPLTGVDGRFSVRIPPGTSSRSLSFAYRAHVGDAQPVAARTLTLQVPASIALAVSPHTTSVGNGIFFRGSLRGGPIPRGGKQLILEARSPGSAWIEFRVVRTNARGRFRAAYRFKFPGPANYRFRARSEPESDFPFTAGSSNVVAVHER